MSSLALTVWLAAGAVAWSLAGCFVSRLSRGSSPVLWVAPALAGGATVATLAQLDTTFVPFHGVATRAAIFWVLGAAVFTAGVLSPAAVLVRSRWLIVMGGLGLQFLGLVTGGNSAGKISVRVPLVGPLVVTDVTRLALIVFTAACAWRLEPVLDLSLRRRCVRPLLGVACCWAASAAMSMVARDTGAATLTVGLLAVFAYLVLGRSGPTVGLASVGAGLVGTAVVLFPHAVRRVTSFLTPPTGANIEQGQMALFASSSGRLIGNSHGGEDLQFVGSTLDDDFLLAAMGRVLGLCGVLAVVLLVVVTAWVCLRAVPDQAPGGFSTWLGIGAGALLVLQLVLSAGGVFGLLPATGIPVPMATGSGASLLSTYALLGLVSLRQSVRRHALQHLNPKAPS